MFVLFVTFLSHLLNLLGSSNGLDEPKDECLPASHVAFLCAEVYTEFAPFMSSYDRICIIWIVYTSMITLQAWKQAPTPWGAALPLL